MEPTELTAMVLQALHVEELDIELVMAQEFVETSLLQRVKLLAWLRVIEVTHKVTAGAAAQAAVELLFGERDKQSH
jgi:hypothetical protein